MVKLQETVYTMHWPLLCVHELFFYDMPMHRKRVRLLHYIIYVTLCSLLNYKSLLIKIGFDIPWDPGGTTRENPSSSAGFVLTSSAGRRATNKALQLLLSSNACRTRYC